jgi:NAD(P)H-dependent FMN reductase
MYMTCQLLFRIVYSILTVACLFAAPSSCRSGTQGGVSTQQPSSSPLAGTSSHSTSVAVWAGSIRHGRNSITVARWAVDELSGRDDATFELVDLRDHNIPPLTDAIPPSARHGDYPNLEVASWAELIGSFDGFIFATPEYNAGIPGTMKNAFDTLFDEWGNKPVGFIGWGGDGAQTSIRHWRDVVDRARMQAVSSSLHLPFAEAFPERTFTPQSCHVTTLHTIADEIIDERRSH